MVEFKWKCNFCGKLLNDTEDVKRHIFYEHPQTMLYATLVPIDEWKIEKKEEKQSRTEQFKGRKRYEEPEEEEESEEDLRL